ncbi:LppP/LprE family lipoprotein [Alicyclobacillus sp. SO9]|uniref:LppP/LprE family lipoprotein n=1 Tax=Alicyclobacillus sp. SO9 TaxID=2665646 RepID=UPI0018E88D08|nr:LppP/LprE family lipoprotein [Alicyclobacillus sp. SO9]QQE77100.1 LppP/LprE family lipoprotein [Alicyclobacillus sp. SO9]
MNRRLTLLPLSGLMLLTLAGCTTNSHGTGANAAGHAISTTNTSETNVASSVTNVTNSADSRKGTAPTTSQSRYNEEIAVVKSKGYSVNKAAPNASIRTTSGGTVSAWLGVSGADGYNQFVFFFLNGRYLGTDTAKPSVEITSVSSAGNAIIVTYPVYKKNDALADPTGKPITITYTWNGSKLVPNKPYPKQFQGADTAFHPSIRKPALD